MKVKMILPALTEAKSPFWRPIKYSLFPPLGLATLAGYLNDADEVIIQDEHVETLDWMTTRIWWRFRCISRRRIVPMSWPTSTGRKGLTSRWAACT